MWSQLHSCYSGWTSQQSCKVTGVAQVLHWNRRHRFISQLLPSHPLGSYLSSVHSTSTWNPFRELNFPSHLLVQQGGWQCSCRLIEHIPLQNTGAHWTSRSIGHLELRGWATSAPHTFSAGRSEGWGGGGVWKLEAGLIPYAELKHSL